MNSYSNVLQSNFNMNPVESSNNLMVYLQIYVYLIFYQHNYPFMPNDNNNYNYNMVNGSNSQFIPNIEEEPAIEFTTRREIPLNTIKKLGNQNSQAINILPQPNESLEKQRKLQQQLELQKELLTQIEQKQKKKCEEQERKKIEDEMEEQRIRRENEEFLKREQIELSKKVIMQEATKKNPANLLNMNNSINIYDKKKHQPKRPRTPIEEADAIMKAQTERSRVLQVEQKFMNDLPQELEKTLKGTVENELGVIKKEIGFQNQALNEQILDLKVFKFIY